jgi:DNA repair protein RadC
MKFSSWRCFEPGRLYKVRESALGAEELLARLFRSTLAARALLESFENLEALARASPEELSKVRHIGPARAEQLLACTELGRRLNAPRISGRKLRSPEEVAAFLDEMRQLEQEEFRVILLNTKNCVIRVFTVAVGSLNASLVHPREVLKPAIRACAAGIIMVHNHPTGNPEPSNEDLDLTRRFAKCCELIGIEFMDHVIIGDGAYKSLRESDML